MGVIYKETESERKALERAFERAEKRRQHMNRGYY